LGTTPLDVRVQDGVSLMARWPGKIVDVLTALEDDGNVLVQIEKIDL
jgi:translation initiation factor IF-1